MFSTTTVGGSHHLLLPNANLWHVADRKEGVSTKVYKGEVTLIAFNGFASSLRPRPGHKSLCAKAYLPGHERAGSWHLAAVEYTCCYVPALPANI